ncbi:MAG: hypothetical protein JWN82_276 [Candidatus Saccharibacteria bacterium]|nr:hypothetical protein [Candidatus Saccharibacteria bacterium]
MLEQLQARFPDLRFVASSRFCWSPQTHEIGYDQARHDQTADWSLLHETGHALLNHTQYLADFELLRLEMAAWAKARELAVDFGVTIDENHIQDCLDTYRDWLYKRSICPHCSTRALQQNDYAHYRCFNCHTVWGVTPSRFCRAYRATKNLKQHPTTPTAVFSLKKSPSEDGDF